jgi:hypothetical protein
MSFESLRVRAKRLGWTLRRLKARGPRGLASKYSMTVGRDGAFRASDLQFIRLLISEAERKARS